MALAQFELVRQTSRFLTAGAQIAPVRLLVAFVIAAAATARQTAAAEPAQAVRQTGPTPMIALAAVAPELVQHLPSVAIAPVQPFVVAP